MTSRTTFTALLVLFAASTIVAASCGGSTDTNIPPPPKTTTSSVTTSGGGESPTTSAGGAGGTGGLGTGGTGGTGGTASCNDAIENGKETDKDCGGPECTPCNDTLKCKADTDCVSGKCDAASHKCAAPACDDGVKNGTETDLDCGGGGCPGCGPDHVCKLGSDCKGAVCKLGLCAPSCIDGVKNPGTAETDVDCGGGACLPCGNNLACNIDNDCDSKICDPVAKICIPATCTDGLINGKESDIDCGGGVCPQCSAAQKCNGGADCLSGSCMSNKCACPTGMQPVPKKLGGGAYCIDASEVTYGQYQVFYSANPSNLTLPAGCPGAGSYTPSANWPSSPAPDELRKPISDVDWCDAVAYCLYSGKHLCGKVDGGSNAQADSADASKSEWYNACSAQGASLYPYGQTYIGGKCVDSPGAPPGTPVGQCAACKSKVQYDFTNVPSLICQGGTPNVWGMSGNLAEWEDSCDNANPPNCFVRGGSRCEGDSAVACTAAASHPRTYKGCDVGFRCCF